MPSVLLVSTRSTNAGYLPGQIVYVAKGDHEFAESEMPAAGSYYHVKITNRSRAQAEQYMQLWTHDAEIEQLQNDGADRRIKVTSSMVSVSGKNAFLQAPVEEFIARWGGVYVTHTQNSFTFDATVELAEYEHFKRNVSNLIRGMQYTRRRWYINATGMAFLAANDGVASGTAQLVISNYLRDGLLD
jgi:hypothetical protein